MFDIGTQIDKDDPLPRHAQVQRILRDMVVDGRLKPGDKIPAEAHIADALGVSKMTVNKALLALTADGVFAREVGRGTFVAPPLSPVVGKLLRKAVLPAGARIVLSFPYGARNMLDSDYYSNIYRGIADTLEQSERYPGTPELILAPLAAVDYVTEAERTPAEGRIIIAPREESIASLEQLWKTGHPLVVVGASWPMMGVPSIDSDNVSGAMEATRHLIGQGHERIALLLAERETANIQDRVVGYRRALSAARLPYNPDWEVDAEKAWQAGPEAKRRIVDLVNGPQAVTAIFAAGHYLALEAMNAIRDAGRRVPEEVSVIGFDDPLSAQLSYPPLTTIRQPLYEMGRRAAERLLNIIQGVEGRIPIREMLPTDLIVRESTLLVGMQSDLSERHSLASA